VVNGEVGLIGGVGAPQPLTDPALRAGRPQFSPDGTALVFHGGPAGERAIYKLDLQGQRALTRLTAPGGDHIDPFWMPDGSAILWSAAPTGGDHAVWSMAPDGAEPKRLLDLPGDVTEGVITSIEYMLVSSPPCPLGQTPSRGLCCSSQVR
jgi:Tol biopolymer transport system component